LKKLTFKNFPNAENFHPLGIEYEKDTSTLYVINHAREESVIEIFKVSPSSATATYVKTFKHPFLYAPNAIHSLGDGKLFITVDHYFQARNYLLLSKIETFSGAPGGTVIYIDINAPETAKIIARVPFANGIAMLNSTTLAVASTSKTGVYFYEVTPSHDLISKGYVRTPSTVDNISVDGKGKLLLAGHPFAFSLVATAAARANCVPGSENEEEKKACECGAPSWAAEWTPENGLKELYKGAGFCSSSTVVRDSSRGVGMITGLYDKGIMVFKE
jgi:arylesterase/paraoxonase